MEVGWHLPYGSSGFGCSKGSNGYVGVIGDGVSIVLCEVEDSIVSNCGVVGECTGDWRKLVRDE